MPTKKNIWHSGFTADLDGILFHLQYISIEYHPIATESGGCG